MMKATIEIKGSKAKAHGPFTMEMLSLFSTLRGGKKWNGSKSMDFEASQFNIGRITDWNKANKQFTISDNSNVALPLDDLDNGHQIEDKITREFKPGIPLYDHQKVALAKSKLKLYYALLLEMGLGKSAIIVATACILFIAKKITGVVILSPKGVHRQWIEDQIPMHMDKSIKWTGLLWKKKSFTTKEMKSEQLTFLSLNIDAVRTPIGAKTITDFISTHKSKVLFVVDESHLIKTGSADRTQMTIKLGKLAAYRRICTGTPIAKNLVDAWSQFKFLSDDILQHPYMTSFRSRFCVIGGFEGRQIVGSKNIEEFYSLIAPHSFRLTKSEALNLPEKIYIKREYELGEKTAAHYNLMKKTFMTALESGEIVDAQSGATALIRLQQILCGYLPMEAEEGKETEIEIFSDERIDIMMDIIEQVRGPVIIWARFRADIKRIEARIKKEFGSEAAVTYYGETKDTKKDNQRAQAVEKFMSGKSRFFISNPSSGGTGLNLQGECQTAIYFSNSFDAIHRWQSEDRLHRIGTKGAVTYFDLVAAKTIDKSILGSLLKKKSLSTLSLDQIRQAIIEVE